MHTWQKSLAHLQNCSIFSLVLQSEDGFIRIDHIRIILGSQPNKKPAEAGFKTI